MVYLQKGSALTKYEIKKVKKAVSEQERRDQKKEEALKMAEKVKQTDNEKKQVKK